MSSSPRIAYTLRPDVTPKDEAATVASVYRFILDCHAKKKAAVVTSNDGDDAKEGSLNDSCAPASIP